LTIGTLAAKASPALAVLLAFRDAKSCDAKHALLDRARDQGDSRLAAMLPQYEATRGCGMDGTTDCYPCLHADRALHDAISAIRERAGQQ
jgi:hypothetical protein